MLFHLLYDVLSDVDGLGFLRVFRYISTRILAGAITSLLLSFLLGPWFIEKLRSKQIGQQIRDDGPMGAGRRRQGLHPADRLLGELREDGRAREEQRDPQHDPRSARQARSSRAR